MLPDLVLTGRNYFFPILHRKHKEVKEITYRMGEIFANDGMDKGIISKVYKHFNTPPKAT